MQIPSNQESSPRRRSVARRLFDFFSGFGLATVLMLLMGVLTWLATLEQRDSGLHATLQKYFHWKSFLIIPELKGRIVPVILPGGYWVCALLLLNLILGGLLRARKGWRHIGFLIAHSGIVLLLVAGGVAHHCEKRGNMAIQEGRSSDVAEDYFEHVVEIARLDEEGGIGEVHVIDDQWISDLEGGKSRIVRLPKLPFDLELAGYLLHAEPVHEGVVKPADTDRVVDGWYLRDGGRHKEAERHAAGCYARVVGRDGKRSEPFILAAAARHPFTLRHEDQFYTLTMRKRLWPMPFTLHLDKFTATFHPGTSRPASFVSEVTREEAGSTAKVTIRMNEPMRYEGLTFYQASYGPPGAVPGEPMYSVFEVVSNPADQWPKYSLWVVIVGMVIGFITRLVTFLIRQTPGKP
ncbi:MAG TPA: cytochrome c biogenesis protein ResB [Luteolibacter sp.]|nr:cytochrome c biogenesis protein ResB [Luteolibacter sp.]